MLVAEGHDGERERRESSWWQQESGGS